MFLSRKSLAFEVPLSHSIKLQWGRDVSSPEIRRGFEPAAVPNRASMGPGCFYPGNELVQIIDRMGVVASMGPGCFYPGNMLGVALCVRGNYRFTGAGMFLSRKFGYQVGAQE